MKTPKGVQSDGQKNGREKLRNTEIGMSYAVPFLNL